MSILHGIPLGDVEGIRFSNPQKDFVETCKVLLDSGADVDAQALNGRTPLAVAIGNTPRDKAVQLKVVSLLLEHNAVSFIRLEPLDSQQRQDEEVVMNYGESPLSMALRKPEPDVGEIVLKHLSLSLTTPVIKMRVSTA